MTTRFVSSIFTNRHKHTGFLSLYFFNTYPSSYPNFYPQKTEMRNTRHIIAIAFVTMFVLSTIPHSYADITSVDIQKPTYLDHKYKSDPYLCVYSSNPRDLKIAQAAISDWQSHLKSYTKNYGAWNINVGLNTQDRTLCTAEIMYSPQPSTDKFDAAENAWWDHKVTESKTLGLTYTFWDRAWVYVFTSEYYFPDQTQTVNDGSGKLRAVPSTMVSLSDKQIQSITEHELGHVFGIADDDSNPSSNGIMSQGLENANTAHITDDDLSKVVEKYGTTGFIA